MTADGAATELAILVFFFSSQSLLMGAHFFPVKFLKVIFHCSLNKMLKQRICVENFL